jgi:hypothetical protein
MLGHPRLHKTSNITKDLQKMNNVSIAVVWIRIRGDEGDPVRDITEWGDLKMWGGRHCRKGEGSKVEMVYGHIIR